MRKIIMYKLQDIGVSRKIFSRISYRPISRVIKELSKNKGDLGKGSQVYRA